MHFVRFVGVLVSSPTPKVNLCMHGHPQAFEALEALEAFQALHNPYSSSTPLIIEC